MKTVKKNVYYCDYCKKKSLNAKHIHMHELTCTANPDRECHLCNESRDIKTFIEQIKSRFEIKETESDEFGSMTQDVVWKGEKITLNEILDFTGGCPNCTLAILRQTKLNYSVFGFNYDYKKEMNTWWSEVNSRLREEDERSTYQY